MNEINEYNRSTKDSWYVSSKIEWNRTVKVNPINSKNVIHRQADCDSWRGVGLPNTSYSSTTNSQSHYNFWISFKIACFTNDWRVTVWPSIATRPFRRTCRWEVLSYDTDTDVYVNALFQWCNHYADHVSLGKAMPNCLPVHSPLNVNIGSFMCQLSIFMNGWYDYVNNWVPGKASGYVLVEHQFVDNALIAKQRVAVNIAMSICALS